MTQIRSLATALGGALALCLAAPSLHAETTPAAAAATAKVSTEVFAAESTVYRPKLSPDGKRIVARTRSGDQTYLLVRALDGSSAFRRAIPEDSDLRWFRWAGNNRVLFSISTLKEYRGRRRGLSNEFRQVDMYVIDTDTQQSRFIGPEKSGPDGDNVIHVDPDGRFLVMEARESVYKYPSVFKIDLATNESEEVVEEQLRIWDWIADNKGVVRMGISYRANSTLIYYRRSEDGKFRRIDKLNNQAVLDDEQEPLLDGFNVVAGSDDGYVLSNEKTGRFALYRFNIANREVGEQIFAHPEHDVGSFRLNPDGATLEAVRFTDSRDRIKWFDEHMGKQQGMLDRALGGQEVSITSYSRDRSKMIIFSTSPQDPGSYYLYEPAAGKMDRFGGVNDQIDPALMSETKYEMYTARDGTTIPAYLTLPKGREAADLPLIIMPHGGPYGVRDELGFDMEVQFLANRGYAVLQPNYRGSGGYGEQFYKLGEGQIGRAMQDDLDDGMDWLAERGIIDPARVCIVGSSYGGYAALWGVTRNPERYRCAASFAGVTDWNRQLHYDQGFFRSRYDRKWEETVEGEDGFDLDDVSPVRMVDQLQRPVLLVHGKKDSNVPYSQFTLYQEKLEDRGADAVFVTYEEEGHGFKDKENRKDWLDQLEKFLTEHNPA